MSNTFSSTYYSILLGYPKFYFWLMIETLPILKSPDVTPVPQVLATCRELNKSDVMNTFEISCSIISNTQEHKNKRKQAFICFRLL